MLHLDDWMDTCFRHEQQHLPAKAAGLLHIAVHDRTSTPPTGARTVGDRVRCPLAPGASLTFWWRLGSYLSQAQYLVDSALGVASWEEALARTLQVVFKQSARSGDTMRIGSLQFWGHGAPGQAFMGTGAPLTAHSLQRGGVYHDLARQIAGKMDPQHGHIWFRNGSLFQGVEGHGFARVAASIFGVSVLGHTFPIHALQSGTQILRPGEQPSWSPAEGTHQTGRYKGLGRLSDVRFARTVSMFRLQPPLQTGDLFPAGIVLETVAGALTRVRPDDL